MNVTELVEQHQKGERRCQEFVDAVFLLERNAHILEGNAALSSLRSARDQAVSEHNKFCGMTVAIYNTSDCDPDAVQQFLADLDRMTRDGAK